MFVTTSTRTRKQILDAPCAEAVDLAREAAELAGPGEVGPHLGAEPGGERVVTHLFACLNPAYVGWHWAVTVARASRAKNVTIDETVLLPGSEAVLAPAWVPWTDRLLPGDLGPGDILPTPEDDDRLVAGWTGADLDDDAELDSEADPVGLLATELSLAKARVLSPIGRDDAIDRWYSGDRGPTSPLALAAPAQCVSCGFLVPMAGSIGRMFGVCANAQAPDDARVVSLDHGCGAHSEALTVPQPLADRPAAVIDELSYDELSYDDPRPAGFREAGELTQNAVDAADAADDAADAAQDAADAAQDAADAARDVADAVQDAAESVAHEGSAEQAPRGEWAQDAPTEE